MGRNFDGLGQQAVRRRAGEGHAGGLQRVAIGHVDLVAVPVAFGDVRGAVDVGNAGALLELGLVGAQPHGAAEIALFLALFELAFLHPLGHQADDGLVARAEFSGGGSGHAGEIAGGFHHRHLHAEADAEIGHLALTGEFGRGDLAFRAALAEGAGHEDGVDVFQVRRRVFLLEDLAVDPFKVDTHLVGDAAMGQRFGQRLIGVLEARIFADDGDLHLAVRLADAVGDVMPGGEIGLRGIRNAEMGEHFGVQPFGVIGGGHVVDRVHVARLDDAGGAHIAEQAELAALVHRDRPVGAAQQDIGLDADGAQFAHGMLGRLGLHLACGRDPRHQRQVDEHRIIVRQFVAELADRLEEGQALDVAHRAADLAEDEIHILIAMQHERLDGVGHMRDHLHGAAEIVAPALLGEDRLIDLARGHVVVAGGVHAGEPLVVTKVEVGFRTVIGDENFAMLNGAHGARVDIQVGVKLPETHGITARLETCTQRR